MVPRLGCKKSKTDNHDCPSFQHALGRCTKGYVPATCPFIIQPAEKSKKGEEAKGVRDFYKQSF